MKTSGTYIFVIVGILAIFSLSMISCTNSLQNKSTAHSDTNPRKAEAIKKITKLYNKATYNRDAVQSILRIAEKDTMNFESYIQLADLTSEFCYNTLPLTNIAKSVFHAKVETEYFKTLGELAVMRLDDLDKISNLADAISKVNTYPNTDIEKEIQGLKKTANFKTIDEARAYNKSILNKIMKTLPKQTKTTTL